MPSKLITIAHIAENKRAPRLWFESSRLKALGFDPQGRYSVHQSPSGIQLQASPAGSRVVSSRRGIPIIDLNSRSMLDGFDVGDSIKAISSFGRIDIAPTRKTFHIREARNCQKQYRVLELFAGGGTFHDALDGLDSYKVAGALELEARFQNVYDQKAPDVELLQGDIRDFEPDDFPRHDILIAGIPCTDHSNEGRSKKGLSVPEDGEVGNLYVDVLPVIRWHRPLAVIIENVPSYLGSEAGRNLVRVLGQWGYSVTTQIVDPLEWGS